ncbi:hypothetical protein Q2V57_13560 [Enterobacter bugandensis]|uniref:hypothetical protein n=1 Tax=Enterobacter bugandensis TaxID=881260 RepID=UPI0026666B0A|nr:hypothetical protein [Enterobacter bugandensis]MDO2432584.1 hypothetical protein [Enterobacter bugandensis]MDO2445627.1 hypothetical protein [Enterobacter bugandensis]
MSTIFKEFTKEQLIEQAKKNIEVLRDAVEKIPDASDAAVIHLKLAEITLASLEAEPAGIVRHIELRGPEHPAGIHVSLYSRLDDGIELYTAPPAPVSVPDEATPENIEILASTFAPRGVTYQWDKDECNAAADSWNAGRAAMLQGADGNSPVIPDWQAKAEKMAEIHGSSFVLFRNGESPQCADPTKVIISFTDEGLGHGSAAPQQEVK